MKLLRLLLQKHEVMMLEDVERFRNAYGARQLWHGIQAFDPDHSSILAIAAIRMQTYY